VNIILQGFSILVLKRNTVLFLEQTLWLKETARTCTPRPCDMCLFSLNVNLRLKGGKMGGYSAFSTLVPLSCACVYVAVGALFWWGGSRCRTVLEGRCTPLCNSGHQRNPAAVAAAAAVKSNPRRRAFYSRYSA